MKNALFLALLCTTLTLRGQESDLLLPSEMSREQVIHHKGFTLSYNSSYVQPSWVAYQVTKAQVDREMKVKMKFVDDPKIITRSADKKDYKDGGYLMAQFVNYLDLQQLPEAIPESFYMTNITPMKLAFYNHVWLKAEEMIRLWSADSDGLHVVCGPILADAPFTTIGENLVSIPKRYYKVVYDAKNQKAIGFIFISSKSSGTMQSFAVSVDEVESEVGIDLFPSVEDELEKRIEAGYDPAEWDFEVLD
ncbi:MAG: DNA/RNA non-specific endonuclease [Bacteroidales bacterium]|nr:DNA/RNA non-specific endonuclease [Bacteroidales bacterium]